MKNKIIYILIVLISFAISCNKTGPIHNIHQKISHGNYYWKLVKYKVNDIDSTDYINFGNYPNFKDRFFIAMKESKNSGMPSMTNGFYDVFASLENGNKVFCVTATVPRKSASFSHDTCSSLNTQGCQRNVFMPEGKTTNWNIQRLWGGVFILSCKQKNEYYLEMKTTGKKLLY